MSQPEWFSPLDKLSWQIGQMAMLLDLLWAFGVCLLAMALAALVIQLVGLRQLMRAEKLKHPKASSQTSFVKEKSLFRRTPFHVVPVRRKSS